MSEAIASAPQGAYISIQSDGQIIAQSSLEPPENSDFTLDLNGHTLQAVAPFVGSEGTESNAFRFLKGSNITIKNGELKCIAPSVTILVQNFANLTLDNVKLTCKSLTCDYTLSNNFGNVVLKNNTTISKAKCASFDCYYGLSSEYDEGVIVTVEDNSVVIKGNVEYKHADRIIDVSQFYERAKVYIPIDCSSIAAPDGFKWGLCEDKQYMQLVSA